MIYAVAFVTGAIVMSFEMLGSRYLNPYFGSGIYTWAALISTVLGALTVGYFLGGWLADRTPSVDGARRDRADRLALSAGAAGFRRADAGIRARRHRRHRAGSLLAALAIMFFPVTLLGMYSPFAIRLMLRSAQRSGRYPARSMASRPPARSSARSARRSSCIPLIGSRAITLTLGAAGVRLRPAAAARLRSATRRSAAAHGVRAGDAARRLRRGRAERLIDDGVRAAMLKRADGRIAHIETEYNDIFITKRRHELTMSFQLKGWDYTESVINLPTRTICRCATRSHADRADLSAKRQRRS